MPLIQRLKKFQKTLTAKNFLTKAFAIMLLLIALFIIVVLTEKFFSPKRPLKPGYNAAQHYAQVIVNLKTLVAKKPNYQPLLEQLAAAYLNEAIVSANKAPWVKQAFIIAMRSVQVRDDAESERLIGYGNFIAGNYPTALKYYNKSLAIYAKDQDTLANLGQLYETTGSFKQSDSYYNQALAVNKQNLLAQLGEIRSLYRANKIAQANEAATILLPKAQDALIRAGVYEMLGLSSLTLNRDNRIAENYFRDALTLNPMLPVSLASYAGVLLSDLSRGRPANLSASLVKPESLALRAVAIDPTYSYAYAILSQIALMSNDKAKAAAYGGKVIATVNRNFSLSILNKAELIKGFTPGNATSTTASSLKTKFGSTNKAKNATGTKPKV